MKIFVDENIPTMTVQALRERGHIVQDIRGTTNEGMEDDDLWKVIQKEKSMLITTDKGFSHNRHQSHCGMIIVRLKKPNAQKIHQRVMHAFTQFSDDEWQGILVMMRDTVQSITKSKSISEG